MGVTDDRTDPRLTHGVDREPRQQADVYLVLSEEERTKGYVRPVRRTYLHRGVAACEHCTHSVNRHVLTQEDDYGPCLVDLADGTARCPCTEFEHGQKSTGCGAATTMATAIAETYAREPKFYGATYCVRCEMHLPVAEFVWDGTDDLVGS
jgi:hypothetical protein